MATDILSIRIAGTSFRQDEVRDCRPGDRCLLVREDNQHDPNATKVVKSHAGEAGPMLGYIPRDASACVAEALAAGCLIEATIDSVGKATGSPHYGAVLRLAVTYPGDRQGLDSSAGCLH